MKIDSLPDAPPACRLLFEYARQFVTPKDIADFCPSDPGYYTYVAKFTSILETGQLARTHYDISETICLNWYVRNFECIDEVRFRRFRVFTNSVGMAVSAGREGSSDFIPENYLVVSLLVDTDALGDAALFSLLPPAIAELRNRVKMPDEAPNEVPLLSLAQTILAFKGYPSKSDPLSLCRQVIKEADALKRDYPDEFLWGCSSYDQFRKEWSKLVLCSFPADSTDESVALLRTMLVDS
jgi:hypothetical protein